MGRRFAILAAVTAGLSWAVPVGAQDSEDAASATAGVSVTHALVANFLDEGTLKKGALNKGGVTYTFAKPVSFTCRAACTLEVEIMEQVGDNKTAKNLWDICADVDERPDGFTCPYQGALPIDRGYVVGHYAWSVPLKAGKHTAEPTVFVTFPAVIANFHVTYRVYQP